MILLNSDEEEIKHIRHLSSALNYSRPMSQAAYDETGSSAAALPRELPMDSVGAQHCAVEEFCSSALARSLSELHLGTSKRRAESHRPSGSNNDSAFLEEGTDEEEETGTLITCRSSTSSSASEGCVKRKRSGQRTFSSRHSFALLIKLRSID